MPPVVTPAAPMPGARQAWRLLGGVVALAAVTVVWSSWLGISNAATVATSYLMVVLVVAATSTLRVAVATSSCRR